MSAGYSTPGLKARELRAGIRQLQVKLLVVFIDGTINGVFGNQGVTAIAFLGKSE
ncbi:hypothetical protein [Pseudomonas sp. TNT2022 ID642]|uniref:hypothetical protein n=1 Tax=Pseudomonas sp. TNT2022 ID642 TaxID=2942632 RepID=UPI0023619E8D|nr:hypothetical protein [Pseudomonas sp. TNT2022 ID642]MDD1003096.1 hypothetical protein [Pseudomonas sp. TNT2022 ID642]